MAQYSIIILFRHRCVFIVFNPHILDLRAEIGESACSSSAYWSLLWLGKQKIPLKHTRNFVAFASNLAGNHGRATLLRCLPRGGIGSNRNVYTRWRASAVLSSRPLSATYVRQLLGALWRSSAGWPFYESLAVESKRMAEHGQKGF